MADWGGSWNGSPAMRGRSPSPGPGRGGRFDDGPRRSPPPHMRIMDDSYLDRGPPPMRGRSPPGYGRKRRRDDSPMGRDRMYPPPPIDRERDPYYRDMRERDFDPRDYRPPPPPRDPYDRYDLPPRRDYPPDDPYRRPPPSYRDDPYFDRRERERSPPPPSRPQLQLPSEFPYLVTFRYFTDFMRHTSPHIAEDRDRLGDQWRRYKADFLRKQLILFFEDQKSKPWFVEKYSPAEEYVQMRKGLRKKGREGRVDTFLAQLEKGELDNLTFDYAPLKKGDGGRAKENGVVAAKPEADVADTKPGEPEAGEEIEKSAEPGEDVKDEVKEESKPAIGDGEMDEYDDTYEEDVAVVPSAEPAKSGVMTDDVVIIPTSEHQLFVKSISPEISRAELEEKFKEVSGFDYLALSDPHTGKKYHRVGWINFVPGTDMAAAEKALSAVKVGPNGNFTLHIGRAKEPAYSKLRTTPGITNTPDRLASDLTQVRRLATVFETELSDARGSAAIEEKATALREEVKRRTGGDTKMEDGPEVEDNEAIFKVEDEETRKADHAADKKIFDLYLFYLRSVYHTCYYCICVCDFPEELQRRCAKHVRRSIGAPDERAGKGKKGKRDNEAGWAKNLDDKVALLLNHEKIDPSEHGGEDLDAEQARLCAPHILTEGDSKFRCKKCSKLFKAQNFIEKHILTKHSDALDLERLHKMRFLNEYILDPSHTLPPLPTAPEPRSVPVDMAGAYPVQMFHPGAQPPYGVHPQMGIPMFIPPGMAPPGGFAYPPGMFPPQMGGNQRGFRGNRYDDNDRPQQQGKKRRVGGDDPRNAPAAVAMDPRSRNVLAYNDLDGQGGEAEVTLNY